MVEKDAKEFQELQYKLTNLISKFDFYMQTFNALYEGKEIQQKMY